jgi:hypothetical protein
MDDLKRMVTPQRKQTREREELIAALRASTDPRDKPLLQLFES